MTLAPQMVDLWNDDERTGSGARPYLVLSLGPKYATLFSAGLLTEVQIERAVYDRHAKPREFNPKRVAAIIRRNLVSARRNSIRHAGRAAEEALSILAEDAR